MFKFKKKRTDDLTLEQKLEKNRSLLTLIREDIHEIDLKIEKLKRDSVNMDDLQMRINGGKYAELKTAKQHLLTRFGEIEKTIEIVNKEIIIRDEMKFVNTLKDGNQDPELIAADLDRLDIEREAIHRQMDEISNVQSESAVYVDQNPDVDEFRNQVRQLDNQRTTAPVTEAEPAKVEEAFPW